MTLTERRTGTKESIVCAHVLAANRDGGCLITTTYRDPNGYGRIGFRGRQTLLHRRVMEVALGRELEPWEHVLHECDEPGCILIHHLKLGDPAMNAADRVAAGHQVSLPGERNPSAKLDNTAVRQIRRLRGQGFGRNELAKLYGVSGTQVRNIVARRAWRHLT